MVSSERLQFWGLSTNTKPTTDPTGRANPNVMPVGARFYEVDTGAVYDWDGSDWIEALYDTGSASGAVSVASSGYKSAPTVTRPANTTAYSAGDVVGGVITFTNAGPSGGHLLITTADLRIDVAAVPSGMTTFRLYLYDVAPPSALADNAAWDLPSGDRAGFLGYLDLGTPADLGNTLFTQLTNPGVQVKLAAGSSSLFGYLVTNSGFTPAANSEVYVPRVKGVGV